MLFDVPSLISFVSGIMRLEEGDVLLTGTPAGVGQVKPGETVTVKMTYPGLEGEVLDQYEVKAVQRETGYQFSA
jgi:acylpyruvate hydrolase